MTSEVNKNKTKAKAQHITQEALFAPSTKNYGEITGPIVMIGFGSIGRGCLPLIERHFKYDKNRIDVIDPSDRDAALLEKHGVRFLHTAITSENYRTVLTPL